jgi:hypothetical protein
MNNNKNAYEIRLEVLKMAHDDLYDLYHHQLETVRNNNLLTKTTVNCESLEKLQPSPHNIINRAEELYSFVTKN